ncbi:alpha/beta hydrolase [Sphingomonas gei]|uniref:Alpha/beta hydrolase n=1 Tax=Sphingomonas gei TaxID=1395960 RepID=A0A4S1X080_9SPHN|nr:alpha/beta hydrolase [Sphingomonas gei]TGX49053.1 alpha/beta hydrolase [Sphingomonas gei]
MAAVSLTLPSPGTAVEGVVGFTHRYSESNGARIHYVVGGEGPAVLLLHGFPYTWEDWRRVLVPLAAAGFTLIAPDLRGFGYSEKTAGGYSKANVAEDVHAIVQQLGFAEINLVGSDIGAMVAYAYASRYPDEVRRFVFGESLIPGFGLEDRMNPATGGYWHFGFHGQVDVATMLVEGREEPYLMPFWKMMSTHADAEARARERFLPFFEAPGGIRAGFEHYGTLLADGRENVAQFTGKLQMPVLVLNGARGLPSDQTVETAQRVAHDVMSDLVPDAGHTFAEDNPEWVVERLAAFFG